MLAFARTRTLVLSVLALLFACGWLYTDLTRAPQLSIEPLPVGKGTSYLVRAPNGALLLINTGSDASILRALGTHLPPWQRSLAAVLLTDASANSQGGLPNVLARYNVRAVARSSVQGPPSRESAITAAEGKVTALRNISLARGTRLMLGRVAVDTLWPSTSADQGMGPSNAVVLRISYGNTSFLVGNELPPHTTVWLAHIEDGALAGAVLLSSSSPTVLSDGETVRFLK